MQIILLEKMKNLGNLGDSIKVKPGFARNYLIPYGKALPATEKNLAAFEARRAELEKAQKDALARSESRAARLNSLILVIPARTSGEGKLFGSVNAVDICHAAQLLGVEIHRQEVRLPEGPIRFTGEYEITIHLHADLNAVIKVKVVEDK